MTVQVLHGDCLEVMRTLKTGSVDAVVADPPYGVDYQSSWRIGLKLPKIANDKRPFVWWLPEAARVMRDGGSLLCFCRWDVQEAFRLAIEWAGLKVRSQVVWDREGHGLGDLKAQFGPRHDVIWFATKGKFAFPGKRPQSVIRSMRINGNHLSHPNEKPVDLLRQLLSAVVLPGSTILDPFAGSGSTLVAARELGVNAIGIELEADYAAMSKRRAA